MGFQRLGNVDRQRAAALAAGFIIGIVWLVGLRFVLFKTPHVHHHANFAVFVDGQQQQLKGPTFYQEVAACGEDNPDDPQARVHLHDNVAGVVHVHDRAATWGHLFANLRWSLGERNLALDDRILVDGADGKSLSFWLNGRPAATVANRSISSQDVLLISYGATEVGELQRQYAAVPRDAEQYNLKGDPGACGGGAKPGAGQRLRRAVQINSGD